MTDSTPSFLDSKADPDPGPGDAHASIPGALLPGADDPPRVPLQTPPESRAPRGWWDRVAARHSTRTRIGAVLVVVAASTALAAAMAPRFELSNLSMVYLLGVVLCAIAFGRGAGVVAAVLSVAVFDFWFVPPRYTLRVSDTQYLVTLTVMLVVATVIGTLTASLRDRMEAARARERRTAALYRLSIGLASCDRTQEVLDTAVDRVAETIGARVCAFVPTGSGLRGMAGDPGLAHDANVRRAAIRALEAQSPVGFSEKADPREGWHVPLEIGARVLGVLSLRPGLGAPADRERLPLLRALASQTAVALERCRLADEARVARDEAGAERARNALLSSVSHDLRTPLATITGAASGLRDGSLPEASRRELAELVSAEAERLNLLIGNLLEMTRLEAAPPRVRKEWHSLEEVVGGALARLEPRLGERRVRVTLPDDLGLVPLDDVSFAQVVTNLVENAHRIAPPDTEIELSARRNGPGLELQVADRGPGLDPGDEARVFEKFFRGKRDARAGAGLGLAIARAIVEAHGGRIHAANRPGGGAEFGVWLPIDHEPPTVDDEPHDGATG